MKLAVDTQQIYVCVFCFFFFLNLALQDLAHCLQGSDTYALKSASHELNVWLFSCMLLICV